MSDQQATAPPAARTISGRWLVIGMFAMGITATGLLYAYSTLHLGPFKPLHRFNPTRLRVMRDWLVRHFARDAA